MKMFNDKDFLLLNDYGKKLYHNVAAALPIIDPHNHIDPAALALDKQFENLYELWVQHDPYKHRAMRISGVPEMLITGDAPAYAKFEAWAQCFPNTVGNPLFHWSCMELKELFDIDEMLKPSSAKNIWEKANAQIQTPSFSAINILKRFNVELLCTSDDLIDTLEHHTNLKKQNAISCLPSLRGDNMIAFNSQSFTSWLDKLQAITAIQITSLQSYKEAIITRLNFFDQAGCLLSDHSLDSGFTFVPAEKTVASNLFERVVNKQGINDNEYIQLQSHLLQFAGEEYYKRKWKMQLHIGAHRYTSTQLRNKVGPAGGYACIGNTVDVRSLALFLDTLDANERLPKTILYTLNPADNVVFASLTGSYSQDNVKGKIQFGPAWWYNDHYDGITQQLITLSSYGLLSTAIGMTTDSRSILSMVRHQYFRRILCNLIGSWVQEGKLPDDWQWLSSLIGNLSYDNIKNWIKK